MEKKRFRKQNMKTRQLIGFLGIGLILLGILPLYDGFNGFIQNESTSIEVLTVGMVVHTGWTVAFILPGVYIFRKFWTKLDGNRK